jgi:hypothetical protein
MAHKTNESVYPADGLRVFKDLITSYWPQFSYLGNFHSHPYEHYSIVNEIKGFEFSDEDRSFFIDCKNEDDDFRVAIVMTISSLLKQSKKTKPKSIADNILCWTFNNFRFWLNACVVSKDSEHGNVTLLPNSPHWQEKYGSNEVGHIYLHCPYLESPWQATKFGKNREGEFIEGNI